MTESKKTTRIFSIAGMLILFLGLSIPVLGNDGDSHGEEEHATEEQPAISEVIKHHVADNHDWHVGDIPAGDAYIELAVHLPWILYNSETGFQFFLNTHKLEENENYIAAHDNAYFVEGPADEEAAEKLHALAEAEPEMHSFELDGVHYVADHNHNFWKVDESATLLDFSLTKSGLHIFIVCLLMFFVFTSVAKGYRKNKGKAPTGIQSFMEPIILFVRDDIVEPYLGKHTNSYLPYMLTLFFFVLFANLFGLVPWNANITGQMSVTATLAILTWVLTMAATNRHFWSHIFWFPGVPVPIRIFIMMPIELLSIFTKPFALAVRLFANITGGHFMLLALVCLIFIMGEGGKNLSGALGIAPLSYVFTVFIYCLELLVAGIQAYVFVLLSSVFISEAKFAGHDH